MKLEIEKQARIDQYLAERLDISRSKVQKLMKEGLVLVNDKTVLPSYKGEVGDIVEILGDLDFSISISAENIPIDIVYEDDDLLIINKKSGMVVHPAPGNYTGTLVNALLWKFQIASSNEVRPGIVHRLDKDTSGLMVVAKNDWMHDKLSQLMKIHQVSREYWAIVDGIIPHETGTIDAPIGRDDKDRTKMMVTDQNSKQAVTHFRVLERFYSANQTLIVCKLETGRTHQIRVHMAYIGYPIYNDPLYGIRKNTTSFGQFLHSKTIQFIHPRTGKELCFSCDVPLEFQEYLEGLHKG